MTPGELALLAALAEGPIVVATLSVDEVEAALLLVAARILRVARDADGVVRIERATRAPARLPKNTRLLTYLGKTQSIRAWSRELGVPQARITSRLLMGWHPVRALTEPPHPKRAA